MKKTVLTSLAISVMLVMSCVSSPSMDEPYKQLYEANPGIDVTDARFYMVKQGDTLSDISRSHYNNDGFYYPIIMFASRGVVVNPDKIQLGMRLTIPDLERNRANADSRRSMKNILNGFADIEKNKRNPKRALIEGFQSRANAL
jgi:phage tail protein X